jgi:hypothetical protein
MLPCKGGCLLGFKHFRLMSNVEPECAFQHKVPPNNYSSIFHKPLIVVTV